MTWLRRHPLSLVLLVCLIAALAYTLPPGARKPFAITSVWGLVVLASFIGYGSLVAWLTFPGRRIDLGLRAAWGAAALCFVGGLLACVSLMTFDVALLLVALGAAACLFALIRDGGGVERSRRFLTRIARREPLMFGFGVLVLAMLALQFFGAVANWHTNPYDDDIAYLAFAKKLSDTGTLIEPFSLRRLSALGGQTFFLELVGVRAQPNQALTFDQGICAVIAVLLLWGHRAGTRRPPLVFTFVASLFLLALPNISINTASYFSGVVFFFALFRTMGMVAPASRWAPLPLALVAACTMTLRQNYVPVPVFILGISAWFAFRRTRELREPLVLAACSLAALLPWLALSWRSNHTFLYPLMRGTSNPALELKDGAMTWLGELKLLASVALDSHPVRVLPLLLFVAALLRDANQRRPLLSLLLGSLLGLLAVVHGFTESDADGINRYVFGFIAALALAIVLDAGMAAVREASRRTSFAAGLAVVAVAAQLVASGRALATTCERAFDNIEAARSELPRPSRARGWTYGKLQQAVPPAEPIAVLLDEPYFLDFSRNPIWNLDMPGYSSPPPGMPYFTGSEALRNYFRGQSIRYVAFVRGDRSRYHYRRDYWVMMMVSDEHDLWRNHAPYVIDLLDSLSDLAKRYPVKFEDRGMVLVDLGTGPAQPAAPMADERARRDQFVRTTAEREGATGSLRLTSSANVRFETGFSIIQYDPPGDYHNHAFRYLGQHSVVRLRTRGAKPMKLEIHGWVNCKLIRSKPSLAAYVDGRAISDVAVGDDGLFMLGGVIGPDVTAGKPWVDLTIDISSVGWHWGDPPTLMVALISDLDWAEAP